MTSLALLVLAVAIIAAMFAFGDNASAIPRFVCYVAFLIFVVLAIDGLWSGSSILF